MLEGNEFIYLGNEVLALIAHLNLVSLWIWEINWLLSNQLVHLKVVVASSVEGWEANNHLISENTKSPPVNWESMSFLV